VVAKEAKGRGYCSRLIKTFDLFWRDRREVVFLFCTGYFAIGVQRGKAAPYR
jgi:hypothetical protein